MKVDNGLASVAVKDLETAAAWCKQLYAQIAKRRWRSDL